MKSVKRDDTNVAPRRGFIKLLAVACGGLVTVFPFLTGIGVFLDPIRRRQRADGNTDADLEEFVRVAALQSVPADGIPRQFPVIADQHDAWTFFPKQRIGSVFLRRDPTDQNLQCFTSICPHAGCSVSYTTETGADRKQVLRCRQTNGLRKPFPRLARLLGSARAGRTGDETN